MTPNDYLRAYALVNILNDPDCKYTDQSWKHFEKFDLLYNRQSYVDVNPDIIKCFKYFSDCIAIVIIIIIAVIPGVLFVATGWGTFLFLFMLFTFTVSLATIAHKIKRISDLWKN